MGENYLKYYFKNILLNHIVYLTNPITYLKLYGENPPKTW
jgi:hypothetical protein